MAEKKRGIIKLILVAIACMIVFVIGVIYIISPVDIIPDTIPVIGWMDDLVVSIPTALSLLTGIASALAAIEKIINKFRKKDEEKPAIQ